VNALVGLAAAAAAGLGFLWYKKAKEQQAAGMSPCQAACVAAAKLSGASGTTPDGKDYITDACAKGCGLLGPALEFADKAVDAAKHTATALYNGVTGQGNDPRASLADMNAIANGARCPEGSTLRAGSGSMVADHRTGETSTLSCVDASGQLVGTLSHDGTFHAYTLTAAPVAPPISRPPPLPGTTPVTASSTPVTTSQGGVTVTTSNKCAELKAAGYPSWVLTQMGLRC
jgi:hypothetical protein